MKNPPASLRYRALLAEIGQLYEGARHAVVDAYWRIGKRLVEVDQGGADRARYGERLTDRLSADLTARYGQGFSVSNIERMRAFYLSHPKAAAPRELTWAHFVELLPVRDKELRNRLVRRAEEERLTSRELRQLIRLQSVRPAEPGSSTSRLPCIAAPATQGSLRSWCSTPIRNGQHERLEGGPAETPLRRPGRLAFNSYRPANAPGIAVPDGHILVDCGFYVYRLIPRTTRGFELTSRPAYTYPAIVERVVDGDTVWAFVNVGFGTVLREKFRLHGLDAPEVDCPEGRAARDYVARLLPPGAPIVVRSYASDAYGRFVADIFYLPQPVPSSASLRGLRELLPCRASLATQGGVQLLSDSGCANTKAAQGPCVAGAAMQGRRKDAPAEAQSPDQPQPAPAAHTPATFDQILNRGLFLNQELLAQGLATRMLT